VDLLHLRETNQNFVRDIYKNHSEGRQFIDLQIIVSKKIIEKIEPIAIVVANAFCRDLFPFKHEFCENLGTNKITENNVLKGTPVFFTSMLSGQRALDNGSYD
jgi:hypothetical protein